MTHVVRPSLDVADILDSIEFADSFDVIKRTQSIDESGIASDVTVTIPCVTGAVIPNKSANLMVTPDGERLFGSIMIYSKYPLSPGRKDGGDADLIIWNKRQYIVESIDNFQNFGRGFTSALCSLYLINPQPT